MTQFKASYEELRAHCTQIETSNQELLQESSLFKQTKIKEETQENERHQRETEKLNLQIQKLQNENVQLQQEVEECKEGYEAEMLELRQ